MTFRVSLKRRTAYQLCVCVCVMMMMMMMMMMNNNPSLGGETGAETSL